MPQRFAMLSSLIQKCKVSALPSNFGLIEFIVMLRTFCYFARCWLKIACLRNCIRHACAELVFSLLLWQKLTTYFHLWGRFAYSLSNFQRRSLSFQGCLLAKSPMSRPVLSRFLCPVENRPKFFWRKWGQSAEFRFREKCYFGIPKHVMGLPKNC